MKPVTLYCMRHKTRYAAFKPTDPCPHCAREERGRVQLQKIVDGITPRRQYTADPEKSTYRHRDPDKRRAYMRQYMRERRANEQ